MSTLVERLRKIASAIYITVEKPVADDIADAARKAADELEALAARLTLPTEVVRYTLLMELYDEEEGRFSPGLGSHPEGEWVRYEDHAAALAARAVPAEVVLELSDTEREHILIEQAVGSAYNDSESEEILALLRDFNTVYAALAASEAKRKDALRHLRSIKLDKPDGHLIEAIAILSALDQPKTEDAV